MVGIRILGAIIILVVVVTTVLVIQSIDKISLTAEEQTRIVQACFGCHDEAGLSEDSVHGIHDAISCVSCHDNLHPIHANVDCQDCHAGTEGLKTADEAHDALKWIGVSAAGMLVAALAVNFTVAKKRLQQRGDDSGRTNA